jgi:DNA polymerase III subunit delta'
MDIDIKGQDKVIRILSNAIEHNRISQAYLFHGPEGVGKFTTALNFGMAINCIAKANKRPCGTCVSCRKYLDLNHPDFSYIFPIPRMKTNETGDMKSQSVDEYLTYLENRKNTPWLKVYFSSNAEIRKESIDILIKKLEFTQLEGKYRICIIEDADEMNQNTSNSFLKTLEEPPINTVFILITTKLQAILPTILSRCQLVFFQPLSYKLIEDILISKHKADKQTAKTYSRIANGNLEQAIRLSGESKHESRNLVITFLVSALKHDDTTIISMLSSARERLKTEMIHDMLYYLAMFIHDITSLGDGRTDVINSDNQQLLASCSLVASDWEGKSLAFLNYIDDLHQKLDGNVNVQFILVNLYHKLKEMLS